MQLHSKNKRIPRLTLSFQCMHIMSLIFCEMNVNPGNVSLIRNMMCPREDHIPSEKPHKSQ